MSDLVGVSGAMRDVRAKEITAQSMAGGARRFAVEIPIIGYGLVTTQIWFPALYVEKPLYNWGFETTSTGGLTSVPDARAMIHNWNYTVMEESKVSLYKGCQVMLQVKSNISDTISRDFSFTMFFEGAALAIPVGE